MKGTRLVEICVTDLASAQAAARGGADRIELCADLASGGVTPSIGLITRVVRDSGLPVHVLIRPRAGDFRYDADELGVMALDIGAARAAGAAGVVFGILTAEASVDSEATARLVGLARPLSVTFHKAIDLAADPIAAIDVLVALGIDRVLTSGGPGPARENMGRIEAMVRRAAGRLAVMAGGGLRAADLPMLFEETGALEVHLASGVSAPMVDEGLVREIVRIAKG